MFKYLEECFIRCDLNNALWLAVIATMKTTFDILCSYIFPCQLFWLHCNYFIKERKIAIFSQPNFEINFYPAFRVGCHVIRQVSPVRTITSNTLYINRQRRNILLPLRFSPHKPNIVVWLLSIWPWNMWLNHRYPLISNHKRTSVLLRRVGRKENQFSAVFHVFWMKVDIKALKQSKSPLNGFW